MVSKARIDWSLFLLRLAVGGMAFVTGLQPLLHARLPTTLPLATHWGLNLAEMLCGVFMLLGLWMPVASIGLTLIIGCTRIHSGEDHGRITATVRPARRDPRRATL